MGEQRPSGLALRNMYENYEINVEGVAIIFRLT